MKALGINGSARRDGNTALIMNAVLDEMRSEGVQCELVQLAGCEMRPCEACYACRGAAKCRMEDDAFNECFGKMRTADAILLGSPVYSADVSARMKAFLERAGVVVATNPGLFRHKVGASVAAVRRGGGMAAVDAMNHFLLNKEMIVAGSTYWNMVYGRDVGDVLCDEEGMNNMKNLGRNMAWLLKRLRG